MKVQHLLLVALCLNFCILSTNADKVRWYVTTLDKSLLFSRKPDITPTQGNSGAYTKLTVNENNLLQNIYGYGAALTQSSAFLLKGLKDSNNSTYWGILYRLFDPNLNTEQSAGMKVLRLPIGASDFSVYNLYTFDDVAGDYSLSQMSLDSERQWLVPVLEDIVFINPKIKIIGCPWSAPVWMKTSAGAGNGFMWGSLREFDAFARYFVKFAQLFAQEGINIYAISMQNEPLNEPNSYPVMRMSPQDQANLAKILGPKLNEAGLGNIKIVAYDHNWDHPEYPIQVFQDQQAYQYLTAAAFHCYGGNVGQQNDFYYAFPQKEVWFTECTSTGPSSFPNNLPWHVNNLYLGATQNWASMVMMWNLALNENWGPHYGGCDTCRGVITIAQDYSYVDWHEEYYGMAHFGKFISNTGTTKRTGSNLQGGYGCVDGISFKNSDGSFAITMKNFCNTPQDIAVQRSNSYVQATIPVGLTTFYWTSN